MKSSPSIPPSALVMGLGRFGGGLGLCKYLLNLGTNVTLTDTLHADALAQPLSELQHWIDTSQLTLHLGNHTINDFQSADLLVVNPAVPHPWDNQFINAARDAGARITTEIAMLIERLPNRERIIAITGTLGKSTTASMIHHAMQQLNIRAHLGGNIGGSLLNSLDKIQPDDWIILELSSAQLYWLNLDAQLHWSPHIAIVTNLQPNHLDWHQSEAQYEQSKRSLCAHQHHRDIAILPETLRDWATPDAEQKIIDHALHDWPADVTLRVVGEHNKHNAVASLLAIESALPSTSNDDIARAIATFPGLPHRLQLISTDANNIRSYNDSKSSTPQSTNLALRTLLEDETFTGLIHLIAGGHDKKLDLSPMFERIPTDRLRLYAIGTTAKTLDRIAHAHNIPSRQCHTLEQAVLDAQAAAKPSDTILLSPACASWDQFTNFQERGKRFESLIFEATASATS